MKECAICKKQIDTRNDTFVMVRVEDSHEYNCFRCYKERKVN